MLFIYSSLYPRTEECFLDILAFAGIYSMLLGYGGKAGKSVYIVRCSVPLREVQF